MTKLKIIGPYNPDHKGPFCTRDGKSVEILTTKGRGMFPIVGYFEKGEHPECWRSKGQFLLGDKERPSDIMCAEEIRAPEEIRGPEVRFFNIYNDGYGDEEFATREEADKDALSHRIAVKRFVEDLDYDGSV